jgi:glycosyltransferase involved in cell wall biosynthesis
MGWTVEPEDVDGLVAALASALSAGPERLRSMGRNARALAEHAFDMRIVARRYVALFEALRGGRACPGAST